MYLCVVTAPTRKGKTIALIISYNMKCNSKNTCTLRFTLKYP